MSLLRRVFVTDRDLRAFGIRHSDTLTWASSAKELVIAAVAVALICAVAKLIARIAA